MDNYLARRTQAIVLYNGKNISDSLAPYLKSLTVTDNMGGSADDLQITLEDRAALWQGLWFPEIGATLDVSLLCENWAELPGTIYRLGLFEIDEVTSSSPPSEVQIKAVSVPNDNHLRGIERTRSWEKAELKRIAKDIATDAALTLAYEPDYNPVIDRAEQSEESDLIFLYKLLQDHGLALKIFDKKLVIFDEADYEKAKPTIKIHSPKTNSSQNTAFCITSIKSYSLKRKLRDVYKACHVKYQSGKKKNKFEATFTDPHKTSGKTLQVNEQVKTQAEAERLAKKRLRAKNCQETTGSFSLLGNPLLLASNTIALNGFGAYDGSYIVTRATHSIGDGFSTDIEIRRCLDGY